MECYSRAFRLPIQRSLRTTAFGIFVVANTCGHAADLPVVPAWEPIKVPAAFNCGGRCAVALLIGPQLATDMEKVFGLKSVTPPWQYRFDDSVLVGGALSYRLLRNGEIASIEGEVGVGQRFGSLRQTEGWAALYVRWSAFPWNAYLRTSVAISTGLNYATSATQHEIDMTPNRSSTRVLHYLAPEITFALPQMPETEFLARLHHRSGGGKWWDSPPVYGGLFHANKGGTQYLVLGLRQRF